MTLAGPVRPVLVLDDGGTVAGIAAQRWAAAEASRRDLPLQLVGTPEAGAAALRRLRGEYPQLAVGLQRLPDPVGRTVRQPTAQTAPTALTALTALTVLKAPRALTALTAGAAVLAVPAPAAQPVLSSSFCPTAVVPADETALGRVVVGIEPSTPEEVLRTAVDEALERDAELVAVRVRRAGGRRLLDLARLVSGRLRPDGQNDSDGDRPGPGDADAGPDTVEGARRELEQVLSPWRIGYPELRLHALVVPGDARAVLTMLSVDAELLVLGRSGRGDLLRALAGPPGDDSAPTARCPVLVVP